VFRVRLGGAISSTDSMQTENQNELATTEYAGNTVIRVDDVHKYYECTSLFEKMRP
jgi:hypothetical protein